MSCEPDIAGGSNTLLFCNFVYIYTLIYCYISGLRTSVKHTAQSNELTD